MENGLKQIQITLEEDGTIKTLEKENEIIVQEINATTKVIMKYLAPVIEFIKENIFPNEEIMSHELVVSPDRKILALCDLSSNKSIMEIKTNRVLDRNKENYLLNNIAMQIYYQSKNRFPFLLSVVFEKQLKSRIQKLKIIIYSVKLIEK